MVTQQPQSTENPSPEEHEDVQSVEIRLGLVLYGGVSLAIYENGVARSFYDLVKAKGPFKPILNLLDARAVVDVIAGTSAGGINGLLLATCLESGVDFAETADIWREAGDLGALLRQDVGTGVASLLDGEGYYQQHLYDAFRRLMRNDEGSARSHAPSDIDLFMTGTSVEPIISQFRDDLGCPIVDTGHRVVFHLKHRKRSTGGRWFGLQTHERPEGFEVERAALLASIARITSTFPVAFPPFTIDQVDAIPDVKARGDTNAQHGRAWIEERLGRLGSVNLRTPSGGPRHLIDGGVLDNKPFGPAIRAIFYRMTDRVVDRRLFFVEPDPEDVTESESDAGPSPAAVAVAALTGIPSHESITGDLIQLAQHNARVDWMDKALGHLLRSAPDEASTEDRANAAESPSTLEVNPDLPRPNTPQLKTYVATRLEALAKSMLISSDGVPAAHDPVPEHRMATYRRVVETLKSSVGLTSVVTASNDGLWEAVGLLNRWDADHALRRCFHLFYDRYGKLKAANREVHGGRRKSISRVGQQYSTWKHHVAAVGRVINALYLVREMLLELRKLVVARAFAIANDDTSMTPEEIADGLIGCLARFLCNEAPWWKPLEDADRAAFAESGTFDEMMAAVYLGCRRHIDTLKNDPALVDRELANPSLPSGSILAVLGDLVALPGTDIEAVLAEFSSRDAYLYPAEYLTGIHERDHIETVRISPRDARTAIWDSVATSDKVAGDSLGHFAAFLRRDWRSNDLLWGQLDGAERLLTSLLDDETLEKAMSDPPQAVMDRFSEDRLRQDFSTCPAPVLADLAAKATSAFDASMGNAAAAGAESARNLRLGFREALIQAVLTDIVHSGLENVLADLAWQNMVWGNQPTDWPCDETLSQAPPGALPHPGGGPHPRPPDGASPHERPISHPEGGSRSTHPQVADHTAKMWARAVMQPIAAAGTAGEVFSRLGLGAETAAGRNGRLPPAVLGEYTTRAFLLVWALLDESLARWGSPLRSVLRRPSLRGTVYAPVKALNVVFSLHRQDRVLASTILVLILGISGTLVVTAFGFEAKWIIRTVAVAVFVVSAWLISLLTDRRWWAQVTRTVRLLATVAIAGGVGFWIATKIVEISAAGLSVHPLQALISPAPGLGAIGLTAIALGAAALMWAVGRPLQMAGSKCGIVDFELAGAWRQADRMVKLWARNRVIPAAAFQLGLDYLFIPLYSTAIATWCVWAGLSLSGRWSLALPLGVVLAYGQWVAGAFDCVENFALLRILAGNRDHHWPRMARGCAIAKFALVIAGLVFVAGGIIVSLAS